MDQQWGKLVLLLGGGLLKCCLQSFFFFDSLQEFEDLDEITARYIQPMASFARDMLGHKYFQECNRGNREVCILRFFFCDIVLIIELWAVCLFCLGLHILSCSSCSLSVRKWKSCWCGQRGRSPPSSLTLFQHAKIYQENSSWATNHVQNHGKRKCLFPTFMKENVKSDV